MFEYFKLKKTKLQAEVIILNDIIGILDKVKELSENSESVIALANKLQNVDMKDFVPEIVKNIKDSEKKES